MEKYVCYFSYALVDRADDRDGAERQLYLSFEPECNDPTRIPTGPDIEINPKNASQPGAAQPKGQVSLADPLVSSPNDHPGALLSFRLALDLRNPT